MALAKGMGRLLVLPNLPSYAQCGAFKDLCKAPYRRSNVPPAGPSFHENLLSPLPDHRQHG